MAADDAKYVCVKYNVIEIFSKNLVGPWKFIRSYGGAIKIFGILNNLTQAPLTIVYVRSLSNLSKFKTHILKD